ncbi:MAG: AAA family ATPase [Calditrichaeota bacterium]|nr:MAG: AAA family ATPase [Calditrichota bacterium]MBL1204776.1 AAA family ATPase [Calditrichota bacterium]NOG44605.1 AAA family ATPase [Calditrichota bacterium]
MDNATIDRLREALKNSPDNVPLKLHLAETLLSLNRLDEAEKEYQELLALDNDLNIQFGMARVFFAKGEYSKCNVILEELVQSNPQDFDVLLLHTKALVKENSLAQAIEIYKSLLEINPAFTDEDLDAQLRVAATLHEDSEIDEDDPSFIQKPTINFDNVGGMDDVKKEIDLKIIQPLKHPEIYKAYGKKIGGGILLYGPPGCGKTYLAKATAGQVNARFISVSLNDILDMWIGNSEKNLHEIFEIARQNTPCVLFFDEIDALGASRSDMKQSGGRHLINQFLQELDGLENDNEGVLILGATNAPWHLDSAFRRPGRFDRIIFVPPPDASARELILKLKLEGKPSEAIDYAALAKKTEEYSGADIEALVDISIEGKLEQAIKEGIPKPITTKDLQKSIKKHKPTTKEWFSSAKNFALYANNSGLYDDILSYLKIDK